MPQLLREKQVEKIIGVDVTPPTYPLPGVEYHQLDVRSRQMARLLDGADVLVHLAFVIFHRGQRRRAEEINIDASLQAFEMAARRGLRRVVMASSFAVYGAHPDNTIPIDEDWPLRGNKSLHYSWAKRIIEEYLQDYEVRHPNVEVVRLRPCTVWGPSVPTSRAQLFLSSISIGAKPYDAPIQLLHEHDVARAFVSAVTQPDLSGAFNVAPHDWVRPADLRELLNVRAIRLPGEALRLLNTVVWRLKLTEISPQWLILARHPIVLSNQKIRRVMGWEPQKSTIQTARETVALIKGESPVFW